MFKQLREMPRDLLIVTLAMIIANLATGMYLPFLALYLESLGANVQQVGLFFTLEVILSVCFRILGGWISDNMGRLQAIAMGGLVGLGARFAFALAPTWEWAIIGALLGAIGSALVGPSFQAFTAEKAPEGKTGSTFGIVSALFLICMIIGPLLGGFMIDHFGYSPTLWTTVAIFFVAASLRVWTARGEKFTIKKLQPATLVRDVRVTAALLLAGGLLTWLFIVDGLFDSSFQIVMPFLPKYGTEVGKLSETAYGGMTALMSVVAALVMIPSGMLSDKVGERVTIALSGFTFMLCWLVLIAMPTSAGFVIAFALAGVAMALRDPAFSALLSKAVPSGTLGITFGVFWTALGVMAIPTPYIGGVLYHRVSPEMPFAVAAILSVVLIPVAMWKLHRPTQLVEGAKPLTATETGELLAVNLAESDSGGFVRPVLISAGDSLDAPPGD